MDVAVLDCKGRGGGGQRQLKYIAAFCEFGLFVRVGSGGGIDDDDDDEEEGGNFSTMIQRQPAALYASF